MPSRCDSTQQVTWSKQLKRAEEDGRLRCRTALPVGVTARELVNVSRRITMNEGMVGALSSDDAAAGIQANASHRVERVKWRALRCAHAKQTERRICRSGVSMASSGCGALGCVFTNSSRRRLPLQRMLPLAVHTTRGREWTTAYSRECDSVIPDRSSREQH